MGFWKDFQILVGGKHMFKKRMKQDTREGVALTVKVPDIFKERIVVFSDFHRGDGGNKDHFKNNEDIYCKALNFYLNQEDPQFKLVLAGDIEECWGYCDNIQDIMDRYKAKALKMERDYHKKGLLYRIYGNHDDNWKEQDVVDQRLKPEMGDKNIKVYPAIFFEDERPENNYKILVIHGCQGHGYHDVGDKLAKLAVMTNYGTHYENPSVLYEGKDLNYQEKLRMQETYLLEWALKNKLVLIGGHSHLPYFRSFPEFFYIDEELKRIKNSTSISALGKKVSEDYLESVKKNARKPFKEKYAELLKNPPPIYFNTGCCTAKEAISAIEIDNGVIKMVEWNIQSGVEKEREDLHKIFKFIS